MCSGSCVCNGVPNTTVVPLVAGCAQVVISRRSMGVHEPWPFVIAAEEKIRVVTVFSFVVVVVVVYDACFFC